MARARNIKPSFFINQDLVELSFETRLLFIGLWTLADREGRLIDRPKTIKMAVFPGDDVDVEAGLQKLADAKFLIRYEVKGVKYIQIINFAKHQSPHIREAPSTIPAPGRHRANTSRAALNPDSGFLNPESKTESNSPIRPKRPDTLPASVDTPEKAIYVGTVLTGVKKTLGLKTFGAKETEWITSAEVSFENGFSSADFLECHTLLRKQKWRNSAITAKTVAENLTELEKIRDDVRNQENGTGKQTNGNRRSDGDVKRESEEFIKRKFNLP